MSTSQMPAAVAKHSIVLFDGACPLCLRSVAILKSLNWLAQLHFQDARDTSNLPPCDEPLQPKRLLEEMHVVTADGTRAYAGFQAFRYISWRLPLLWLLAPLLYLPGVLWLGNRVYLWVARNRFKLVPCKDGVCAVPVRTKGNSQASGL